MAPVEGSPRALDAKGRPFFDGGKNRHRPFEAQEMGRYPVLTTRVAMHSIEELVLPGKLQVTDSVLLQ